WFSFLGWIRAHLGIAPVQPTLVALRLLVVPYVRRSIVQRGLQLPRLNLAPVACGVSALPLLLPTAPLPLPTNGQSALLLVRRLYWVRPSTLASLPGLQNYEPGLALIQPGAACGWTGAPRPQWAGANIGGEHRRQGGFAYGVTCL